VTDSDVELKQYICQNCGAGITVEDAKCPYCEGFNYEGAERKYFKDLNQIKEDLKQQLEEIPTESYRKEVSVQISKILKTLLICIIIAIVLYGIISLLFSLKERINRSNLAEPMEQLIWDRENFPKLDEWYEAGEYDKLIEFRNELYSADKVYTYNHWQHEDFLWFYEDYRKAMDVMEKIERGKKYSLLDVTNAIYGGIHIVYNLENAGLDEDEIARLEEFKTTMKTLLFDPLKFTEEEALKLYEDTLEYGFLNYKEIENYASDVMKRLD